MRITNIKCREEGEKLKLTWSWPQEIEQVYVFENAEFENGRLFTLQEYKKRGGVFLKKPQGVSTYYICAFRRENGEDILFKELENAISFTNKTEISCVISKKSEMPVFGSQFQNHEITLTATHTVPADTICYTKNENGIVYFFGEQLQANEPTTRIIRTEKNEYIRPFVREESTELFLLI
ncbi:MAG: hypothetical protein FWB96_00790 [Defluviitaleaceae bacterium]|nr:hypothetical protein [Defluviitaleaceae bacterium]MCL2262746.1 hypothetical protein [Defluviitaleaceae bacterium]